MQGLQSVFGPIVRVTREVEWSRLGVFGNLGLSTRIPEDSVANILFRSFVGLELDVVVSFAIELRFGLGSEDGIKSLTGRQLHVFFAVWLGV